ncbi:MAG: hypothetical protein P8J02_07970 [Yoonia sp.]|nr:hypothetical protein [Yoonia sp.]
MNRFIFPILFGGILLVATFVLMLFQQMSGDTETADADKPKADNVEYANSGNDAAGGMMFALQMMWEDMSGQTTVKPKVDVLGFVPVAPTGWFETPYKTADGEAITQTSLVRTPIAKSSTNTMLMQFDALAQGKGNGFARTYRRGEQSMAFTLYVPDQFNERTIRGGIMAAVSSNMTYFGDFGKSRDVFALHHGVPILEADGYVSSKGNEDDVPVDYRVFNGDVGGMFKFQILTNSSDAAVANLLRAVPVGEMIALLPDPEPHLLISADFQTRVPEPSTAIPETPSIARRAYLVKKTRLDFSKNEQDFLHDMSRREIRSWEDVYEDYGTALAISPEIKSLLGPMPELTNSQKIEYTARAYLQTDREWTENEDDILGGMSRQRIAERKDVDRYLKDGETLADDVIALINLLPETYDAADASAQTALAESPVTARDLVIRRGTSIGQGEATFGNCKIELGVRRCVVGAVDGN